MSDRIATGLERLRARRRAHMSTTVTYVRGEHSAALPATLGMTVWRIDGEFGARTRTETRDFIVEAADLVLDGAQVTPEAGDRITEVLGDETTAVYEVMSPDVSEPAWRYSDPHRGALRIHTKQVS